MPFMRFNVANNTTVKIINSQYIKEIRESCGYAIQYYAILIIFIITKGVNLLEVLLVSNMMDNTFPYNVCLKTHTQYPVWKYFSKHVETMWRTLNNAAMFDGEDEDEETLMMK